MRIRWTSASSQHHDAFHQPRNPSGALQVADVGLGAGKRQNGIPRLHRVSQRAHLDGVAERRAGAMAFGEVDVPGLVASLPHRRLDARLLRWTVRRRHARAAAILIDLCAQQASALVQPVRLLVAAFEVDQADALASGVAVAALVEGKATALGRDHAQGAHADVGKRPDLHTDASGDGLGATALDVRKAWIELAWPHPTHRNASSDQRGGACCVGRANRAMHVEHMRQPAGGDGLVRPLQCGCGTTPSGRYRTARDLRAVVLHGLERGPIGAGVAEEHTDARPAQRALGVASLEQDGVPVFEHDALRRRHELGLRIRDVEEPIVECVNLLVGAESAMVSVALADDVGLVRLRAVGVCVPPHKRDGQHAVGTLQEHGPILVGAETSSG
mmetsp:Transcript_124128/g.358945  ORF Transcript_124128/g.358945 Transcript_124128/m.358945 type:complete len:387 (+) Transcript_124128:284-1444(+)